MPNWLFVCIYFAVMAVPSVLAVLYVVKTPKDRLRTFPFLRVDLQIFWITFSIVGTFVGAILTLLLARAPIPIYEKDAMKREAEKKKSDSKSR